MNTQRYKYQRKDFGELPVKLHHLEIYLNFIEGRVEATSCLEMTAKDSLEEIRLDANSLEIRDVEWLPSLEDKNGQSKPLYYEYLYEKNTLIIKFPRKIQAGESFSVRTFSTCTPSDHILEGIYKDTSSPGIPQQYMSQCQQWGFQRIMPIFDDCLAKCTMTTTIEADSAYTHLISNGNISRKLNPDGKPVLKPGRPDRQVITFENPIPMAPYLFVACIGTWDTLADEVKYDSGRTVRLEYLVPPGSKDDVVFPMEILKEAILWVRKTQDYEYTGETYRTICMNKSNFGGMENVGNTTIVTDAAVITNHTLDFSVLYAHAVIVHEFEHNQCGSETTMESPFDVWLNEAYTVDVERQFLADLFQPAFIRLHQVDSIRNPLLGPLAIEDAGHVGKIVREGFNDPNELIDGVTYVKAAEVIRMLRLIIGSENFHAGKTLYFSRYKDSNANTDQFFKCFEEVSGRSLEQFKRGWLYTIGYPKVIVTSDYDKSTGSHRINFHQEVKPGQVPFHIPIELALVDKNGEDISGTRRVFELTGNEGTLTFQHITEPPAFASINRDYSFYGTFSHRNITKDVLTLQTRTDPNAYNRLDAMRQLTDYQRIRLLLDRDVTPDPHWLALYGEILSWRDIPSWLKSYFLRIDEQPLDRAYCIWYPELVVVREKLMLEINRVYRDQLLEHFWSLDTYSTSGRQSFKNALGNRMLKNVLLDLLVIDDSIESHKLILSHLTAATTATDRVAALLALNRSSSPSRSTVLEEFYGKWHSHLSGYANYLRVVASGTNEDVFAMIDVEKKRPSFDITQPTWSRALFLSMASNNKMVWTDKGINWVTTTVVELAPINATIAGRLLNTFQHVKKLKPPLQEKIGTSLKRIVRNVPDRVSPSIHGQATAYLKGGAV